MIFETPCVESADDNMTVEDPGTGENTLLFEIYSSGADDTLGVVVSKEKALELVNKIIEHYKTAAKV